MNAMSMNNPTVETTLDYKRATDSEYLERKKFELFVTLHRYHQLSPSVEYEYVLGKRTEGFDIYLSMARVQSRDQIAPGVSVLFLDRAQVLAYIAELNKWNGSSVHS